MTPIATDNLAALIRKKHQILVQLREIGLRQQALAGEATPELLKLLGAKQHLISGLEMVERNLRPYHAEDPESREWRTPSDRAACAQQAQACQVLLGEVMELERQQEQRMAERRDQVASQLRQAGAARDAVGAYGKHQGSSAAGGPKLPTTDASAQPIDFTAGSS